MTPKEKAKELVEQFYFKVRSANKSFGEAFKTNKSHKSLGFIHAKQCALISVNEILNLDVWEWPHNGNGLIMPN